MRIGEMFTIKNENAVVSAYRPMWNFNVLEALVLICLKTKKIKNEKEE